jgi:trigger factor
MKVTQEKLPASQIGLEIEIPPEKSKQTYEQVIQKFARAANIPGFRKGKVPRQILLQRLGLAQVKAAAVEELIQSGITEAIKQEKIEALGQPQLRSSFEDLVSSYEAGKTLTFSVAVDVQPEINLAQYTGLKVQAEEVKYDPASVDKTLEEQRSQMATLIPVEGRAAQMGDIAVVDFKGHFVSEGEEADKNRRKFPVLVEQIFKSNCRLGDLLKASSMA